MASSGPNLLRILKQQIADDKASNLIGLARIRIAHLTFPNPIREIDEKNLSNLAKSIDAGLYDEKHPIPAIVDDQTLLLALQTAGIHANSLKTSPLNNLLRLEFPKDVRLECFKGQHRALAAKKILPPADRWWTVELYGKGLGNLARQSLRDGYFYSVKYTDGEIFRYMRGCKLAGDVVGEQLWRARFSSETKERDLKQLLKRETLLKALDSILPVRGLWKAFHVGSLDIFLSSRFDEPICHYAGGISETWNYILENDPLLFECTDAHTVESIQLRAPALSKYDAQFIQNQMSSKRLFPEIQDPVARQGITLRLLKIEQPIATIYSLFKDLRFLQPPLRMLRCLIPKLRRDTLLQALYFHFSGAGCAQKSLDIQTSENSYFPFTGSQEHFFDLALRQLVLLAIRHCAKSEGQKPNFYSIFALAALAQKLGFSSAEIDGLLAKDPYQRVVLDLVQRTLPNQEHVDVHIRAQPLVREFKALLDALSTVTKEKSTPWVTVHGLGEPLSRRCGTLAWKGTEDDESGDTDDMSYVFLDQIHTPLRSLRKGGGGISSFYVKQSIYLKFFGTLPGIGQYNTPLSNTTPVAQENSLDDAQIHAPSGPSRDLVASDPGCLEGASNLNESTEASVANQVTPFAGPIITFMENGIAIREVPYEEECVTYQAREYADQGKKFRVLDGPHFLWKDCFDILGRTKSTTVIVETIIQPISGKRRRDQDVPERLQVVTKDAYDFVMAESEEQL